MTDFDKIEETIREHALKANQPELDLEAGTATFKSHTAMMTYLSVKYKGPIEDQGEHETALQRAVADLMSEESILRSHLAGNDPAFTLDELKPLLRKALQERNRWSLLRRVIHLLEITEEEDNSSNFEDIERTHRNLRYTLDSLVAVATNRGGYPRYNTDNEYRYYNPKDDWR